MNKENTVSICKETVTDNTTPRPWHFEHDEKNRLAFVNSEGETGGDIATCWLYPESVSHARLIVHAVNSHATLVEALNDILELFDGQQDITDNGSPNEAMRACSIATDALAKVGGP